MNCSSISRRIFKKFFGQFRSDPNIVSFNRIFLVDVFPKGVTPTCILEFKHDYQLELFSPTFGRLLRLESGLVISIYQEGDHVFVTQNISKKKRSKQKLCIPSDNRIFKCFTTIKRIWEIKLKFDNTSSK